MPKRLTEEQVAQYHRVGYVTPVRVFTPEETADYRTRLEAFEAAQGGALQGYQKQKPHLLFRWAWDAATNRGLLDAVEDLIGPNILLFNYSTWIKDPETPHMVSWHQDATYFGLEPGEQVTAWFALSPATLEHGCMRVLPGTQDLGQLPVRTGALVENNLLSSGQLVEYQVDETSAVDMPLEAGEASFHNTYAIHGSNPNRAKTRRIGFSISYIPTHVRQIGTHRSTVSLMRGVDDYGHFDLESGPPAADCDEAARVEHERCVKLYRESAGEKGNSLADRKGGRNDSAAPPQA